MKKFKKASEVKVGVVGYGGQFNMGKGHLNEMKAAGMTPTAVCEIDEERLDVAETEFPGIETYTSLTAMLKQSDVNLIVIITPHNLHAKQALQCLKAGKNVVVEKPMAMTTAECDAMIKEAKKRKLVISTYHNRHWDGCILGAVKKIKSGAIGDVVRIEAHMGAYGKPGDWWRTSRSISGGIMFDWGVHLLEYSLQLIKSDIVEVSGYAKSGFWANQTKWKKDCNEDEGHAVVRFKDGKWMTLTITQIDSFAKGADRGQLEITGTKGTYIMNGGTWEMHGVDGADKIVMSGKNPKGEQHKYYKNVANHLVKGTKLVISGEWSRRPIHILDLAVKSAKQGKALPAKYK
jgi:scyllo-inositol 2-dehydrogenase (NADP+)